MPITVLSSHTEEIDGRPGESVAGDDLSMIIPVVAGGELVA